MTRELLLGCGSRRQKMFTVEGRSTWGALTTLDNVESHKPDVLFDLELLGERHEYLPGNYALPFEDNSYDELHAYEVLEHLGKQGDARKLLAQFSEFWRVLKPGGHFCATCPSWQSMWAWGDPSHTRIISPGTLVFLVQPEYTKQIGKTPMSDFRHIYKADFDVVLCEDDGANFRFILQAVKPSRISV